MPTYPTSNTGLNYVTYPAGPTASGNNVSANASANTKGSYVEFVASSPFACQKIIVFALGATNSSGAHLFDVAIGAGGAEVVKIANITGQHFGTTSSNAMHGQWMFPFAIAGSTRIALRTQSNIGSHTLEIAVTLVASSGAVGLTSTETVGVDTTTSFATTVDPGGTASTKGAYAQLSASVGSTWQWVFILTTNIAHGQSGGIRWAIDFAIGAGGAEVVLIPDLRAHGATTWLIPSPTGYWVLTYIASSTRIAVRASCSINTATARLIDIAAIGGIAPSEGGSGVSFAAYPG